MDIQEAREAFERRQAKALNMPYEGLKAHFDENSRLFGARYNTGSINEKEWIVWLDAWQAAKAQAVPEGFVLMPRQCTNSMAQAAKEIDGRLSAFKYGDVYQAMIEAQEQGHA